MQRDPHGVSIRVTTSQRDPILPTVCTYMNTRVHTHHTCLHGCELNRCSGIWRRKQKREGDEDRDREWKRLINDYIHMYSILPAPVSPPLLSSKPKPRLPKWGAHQPPPTAYCCHQSPLKGPANTQLQFRQLLPSSSSEEERGLRGEGGRGGVSRFSL